MEMQDKNHVGIYQLFMLALCVYVLLALAADTFLKLDESVSAILHYIDTGICIIFLADFFVNILSAKKKLHYLKWGWIDFVSSIPNVSILRWGRAARAIRIFRLLRGIRSTKKLTTFILAHRAQSAFTAAAFVSIVMVAFSSIAIIQLENSPDANITTPEDAIWWSFVTITTVGYGDKYPISGGGRILAVVLMTCGIGLFGTFTGFVASWFLVPNQAEQTTDIEELSKEIKEIRELLENSRTPERDTLPEIDQE